MERSCISIGQVFTLSRQLCTGQPHHLPQSACKQPITAFRSGIGVNHNAPLLFRSSVGNICIFGLRFVNIAHFDAFLCRHLPVFQSVYTNTTHLYLFAMQGVWGANEFTRARVSVSVALSNQHMFILLPRLKQSSICHDKKHKSGSGWASLECKTAADSCVS